MSSHARKLTYPTLIAYGIGQSAEGIKNQALTVFLLFFYQQVVGIPGSWAGIALGIAIAIDAITDPLAGYLSDRSRTRWGRRHPFILVAAIPLVISFVLLFSPPQGMSALGSFFWLTCFAILVRVSMTFFYVPHLALGAEMVQDYNQRSTVFSFATVCSFTATASVSFLGFAFFFPTTELYNPGTLNRDGYLPFALFFAAAMFVAIVITVIGTRKEIPYLRSSDTIKAAYSFRHALSSVVRNASFRTILIGMMFTTFAIAIATVMTPYMGIHFWGLTTEQVGLASIGTLAGLWIGMPLTSVVTKRLDKRTALVIPALLLLINSNILIGMRLFEVEWFPDNDSPVIFWLYSAKHLLDGICIPIVIGTFNSIFADIADEIELNSSYRLEGVIFAARAFSQKATAALGAIVGGFVLDVIAFPTQATAGTVPYETVQWLGVFEGPVTSAIAICGVAMYLRYKIDRVRHAEILKKLASAT